MDETYLVLQNNSQAQSTTPVVRQDGQATAAATQAARSLLGSVMLLAAMETAWALHRKAYSYSPQLLAQARLRCVGWARTKVCSTLASAYTPLTPIKGCPAQFRK